MALARSLAIKEPHRHDFVRGGECVRKLTTCCTDDRGTNLELHRPQNGVKTK